MPGRERWRELGRTSNGERVFVCTSARVETDSQGTWQFISTRLLQRPGLGHTLTDDLESHFFVLMWVALHWVKHDKAGEIDMELIFDQQRPLLHGIVGGGLGKLCMYLSEQEVLQDVEFSCEPFEKLFWSLWRLFSEYNNQLRAASTKRKGGLSLDEVAGSGADSAPRTGPSVSPEEVIKRFETALELPGWTNDKVADQFPRAGDVATSRMTLPKVETVDDVDGPQSAKRRLATKSAGPDLGPGVSAKRVKRA